MEWITLLSLIGLLSLTPILFLTVWIVAIALWAKHLEAIELARRIDGHVSVLELFPFAIGMQAALDACVPHLGDISVLTVQLLMLTTILRGSPFPYARLRRRPMKHGLRRRP